MKRLSLVALGLSCAAASLASQNALINSYSLVGNQAWTGALGLDFDVSSGADLQISSLGAFDSGQDGFRVGTTILVGIFDRTTHLQIGGTASFTGNAGTLDGAWRFLDISPITLNAGGHYSLVAVGFNGNDLNFNSGFISGNPSAATSNGSPYLTFVGSSRYASSGSGLVYPSILDSGPAIRYGSANMRFAATPEPFTLGLGLAAAGVFVRRRARRRSN